MTCFHLFSLTYSVQLFNLFSEWRIPYTKVSSGNNINTCLDLNFNGHLRNARNSVNIYSSLLKIYLIRIEISMREGALLKTFPQIRS